MKLVKIMTQNDQDPSKELKSTKQEAFCQARGLKGLNQSDSHRSAYNTSNMSDKQRWEESSKLEKTPKVHQRIDYLRKSLTEKTVEGFAKTKDDILIKLESLIEKMEEPTISYNKDGSLIIGIPTKDVVKEIRECLKEQGKLLGYYVEQQEVKDTSQQEKWLAEMEK